MGYLSYLVMRAVRLQYNCCPDYVFDGAGRVRAVVESGLYVHWLMNDIPAVTSCRYSPSIILVREPLSLANLWVTR